MKTLTQILETAAKEEEIVKIANKIEQNLTRDELKKFFEDEDAYCKIFTGLLNSKENEFCQTWCDNNCQGFTESMNEELKSIIKDRWQSLNLI